MRIAVNTRFSGLAEPEGYANFTKGLILNMHGFGTGDSYILMYDRPPSSPMHDSYISEVVSGPRARHPILWKWWYDVSMTRMARRAKADVILSPDGFCSLTSSIPQVLAIHDLAFLHYPEGISGLYRWYYRQYTPAFIRKAAHIITVSDFSMRDILNHYPDARDKISVISNDADPGFRPLSWEMREEAKRRVTGGTEYFLYAGAIHPRKNLINLLKGFSWFKKRHQSGMKLVIAGRMAWKNDAFTGQLSTYKYRDDVILTGYVPQEEMFAVMGAAYALVYPSYWEGFGLPVLEAMRCRVPVITSSNSAMAELAGDAGLYANPDDHEGWGRMMGLLYKDETFREQCIEKGLRRSGDFSWARSAEKLRAILALSSRIRTP
jgi:glycosyltransferase involved in cell wall biosynthesis